MNWYFQPKGESDWLGPYSLNELVMMYDTHKIEGEDLIFEEGRDKPLLAYSLRPTWFDNHPYVIPLVAIASIPFILMGLVGYAGAKAVGSVDWSDLLDCSGGGSGSGGGGGGPGHSDYNCSACGWPKDPAVGKCPHCTSCIS